jgi:hypothetical protein
MSNVRARRVRAYRAALIASLVLTVAGFVAVVALTVLLTHGQQAPVSSYVIASAVMIVFGPSFAALAMWDYPHHAR